MRTYYILRTSFKEVKEFYDEGSWTEEVMTSVVVQKENGKFIQVFGAEANYGKLGEEVKLVSDYSGRELGYGKIISYSKHTILKNVSATYVFK